MALFDLFSRTQEVPEVREGTAVLPPSRTNFVVNTDAVLSLATAYRCVSVITATGQQLPMVVRRNGQIVKSNLAAKPDINLSGTEFYGQTFASLALHGEAFWWVTYGVTGQVSNLTVLDPRTVVVTVEEVPGYINGRLRYDVNGKQVDPQFIKHLRLFTMPGSYRGLGPIQAARQDVLTALRIREYGDSFLSTGGVPTGVLSSTQPLNQTQTDALREMWDQAQEQRGLAVLGQGLAYNAISLSPEDAQYLESQMFSTAQIARLFGVPATWVGIGIEGSSITYSTSEDLARVFLQTTLTQYLSAIENAMSDLLPRGQVGTFKLDALLRADLTTRVNSYKAFVEMGVMSPEEVRKSEGIDDDTTTNDGSPI